MPLSDLIFQNQNESKPGNHGSILPVMYELEANFVSAVAVGVPMIEKAYELSTPDTVPEPVGSIEFNPISSNFDKPLTEATEARRQEIIPTVAQVATMAPLSLQEARLAQARAAAEAAREFEVTEPAA